MIAASRARRDWARHGQVTQHRRRLCRSPKAKHPLIPRLDGEPIGFLARFRRCPDRCAVDGFARFGAHGGQRIAGLPGTGKPLALAVDDGPGTSASGGLPGPLRSFEPGGGILSVVHRGVCDVPFTLRSGHQAGQPACPRGAISRLMHRSIERAEQNMRRLCATTLGSPQAEKCVQSSNAIARPSELPPY